MVSELTKIAMDLNRRETLRSALLEKTAMSKADMVNSLRNLRASAGRAVEGTKGHRLAMGGGALVGGGAGAGAGSDRSAGNRVAGGLAGALAGAGGGFGASKG